MAVCDCVVVGISLSLVKQDVSVLKEQREVRIVASLLGRLFLWRKMSSSLWPEN